MPKFFEGPHNLAYRRILCYRIIFCVSLHFLVSWHYLCYLCNFYHVLYIICRCHIYLSYVVHCWLAVRSHFASYSTWLGYLLLTHVLVFLSNFTYLLHIFCIPASTLERAMRMQNYTCELTFWYIWRKHPIMTAHKLLKGGLVVWSKSHEIDSRLGRYQFITV